MMTEAVLSKIVRKLTGKQLPKHKWCAVCEQPVVGFAPYREGSAGAPLLMGLLDVVGSDLDNWACPSCSAHDRERHLLLYLKRIGLLERFRGAHVLHFAPEKRLGKLIAAMEPARYVRADLFPTSPEIEKINLLDIGYPDESFDIAIANHVLEHVGDDRRGISELHRVLRPGGFAILQTPFSARLHATFEDPGIDDDDARVQMYGQEDHVRLFGRDIFERFSISGLVADIKRHDEILSDVDPIKHGVNRAEPLFLFHRR